MGVTSTASIPMAAAERKIAPTFVWSTIPSSTAMRLRPASCMLPTSPGSSSPAATAAARAAFSASTRARRSSTLGSWGRRHAIRMPRVTAKPVRRSASFAGTTNTGSPPGSSHAASARATISRVRSTHSGVMSIESGCTSPSNARSITFSLSTMKIPFSGSSLLRSWASVRRANTSRRASSSDSSSI